MRTILLRAGLFGAIGLGGVVLGPYLMGGVADLKVGDCFDPPVDGVLEVEEVQRHPCTDEHGAEVVYVGEYPGSDDATFPSDAAFETHIASVCIAAFDAYTGLDFETDPIWGMGYFTPTPDGWALGDRGFSCYAARLDGAPTATSVRAGS